MSDGYEYKKAYFVRAKKNGSWLRVSEKNKELVYSSTTDFAMASKFTSKEEGLKHWGAMRETITSGIWMEPPLVMHGVDLEEAPAKLKLFIASASGRFVSETGSGISLSICLRPEIEMATVFTSQERAMSALIEVMPKKGTISAAVIPLECRFLEPIVASEMKAKKSVDLDPLACMLTAKSLRFDLEKETPKADADSEQTPLRKNRI